MSMDYSHGENNFLAIFQPLNFFENRGTRIRTIEILMSMIRTNNILLETQPIRTMAAWLRCLPLRGVFLNGFSRLQEKLAPMYSRVSKHRQLTFNEVWLSSKVSVTRCFWEKIAQWPQKRPKQSPNQFYSTKILPKWQKFSQSAHTDFRRKTDLGWKSSDFRLWDRANANVGFGYVRAASFFNRELLL
jgi:hypothetical protein